MAVQVPNGSIISIASGYVAADTVSAVSNANPAVLTTSAAHGIATGAFFEWNSGWSRANSRIFRASAASGSVLSPEGFDTSSTTNFPAGGGTGTVREISGWTQIQQILSSSSNGGEQQFTTYQFLEADAERRIPTNKSAAGLTFSIADDAALAGYIALSAANDDRQQRAIRVVLPSGSIILYNAYVSLNKTPSLTVNEIMAVQVTLSLLNEPVRYAS
jgi:hypothetical protein